LPEQKRFKTKYPGVYYVEGTAADGRVEIIYYIFYRKENMQIEEKAGRQFKDDMTPAKAAQLRTRGADQGHFPGDREPDSLHKGDMDGIRLAARILENLAIPVIYLTAYSNSEILERAKATAP